MACSVIELRSGWTFRRTDDISGPWLPVQQVPSEVHVDLLNNGQIQDPFLDLNELSVRWVGEKSWTYRTTFGSPTHDQDGSAQTDLVFQGLDTFATVHLNGKQILKSDNMFIEHRLNVDDVLQPAGAELPNELTIVFESARERGLELVKIHPEHRFIVHQTEISRGPVRKAQYQWGWDWGPILLTCGPWKPVLLETYHIRIHEVDIQYRLSENLAVKARADVSVAVKLAGRFAEPFAIDVVLLNPSSPGEVVSSCRVEAGRADSAQSITANLTVDNAQLWWPDEEPFLYEMRIHLLHLARNNTILAEETKKIGFRKVELVKDEDQHGQSFYFRINNVDTFAGGSCWIPADSFLTRITSNTYRDWIKLAKEGGQNMIRVWGGGIYESDAFYEACDELGILVWQDFAFACANYPTYPEYLRSLEIEARQNVRRLRHHPSLVLFCGNNEDYQIVERYGLTYDFEGDKDPQSWLKTDFPARYIYEYLLPNIVSEESPGAIYHPSSPWGNGTSTTLKVDPIVGDIHQWDMWHGTMQPIQRLPDLGGRFVSEFGMAAYPHIQTLETFVTNKSERYPGSAVLEFHNKAVGHTRRLASYLSENFRPAADLPAVTHLTQVMQADALGLAYKAWRRQWGPQRNCGGVLVWQLNDCWPTISWAIADCFLVRKPAFYAIRRALREVSVGVVRCFQDWTTHHADELWQRDTGHIDPLAGARDVVFDVWVASSCNKELSGEITVRFVSVDTGEDVRVALKKEVLIQPNGTTEIYTKYRVPEVTSSTENSSYKADILIHVSLQFEGNDVCSDTSWPDPIKYLNMASRGLELSFDKQDNSIHISAAKPVKGLVFSERRGSWMSDNALDVVPGETIKILVKGIDAEELVWTYIQNQEA